MAPSTASSKDKDKGKRAGAAKREAPKREAAPEQPRAARPKVPFPKKNQAPTEAEFVARLPMSAGKRFEALRTFLKKQKGVSEDLYYYGPKTGWAYRYVRGSHSLATIMIHDERLVGIVALDAATLAAVDFGSLSEIAQKARKLAHGSPVLSWLDLPLDGPGASDFKTILKTKLKVLPVANSSAAQKRTPPAPPPPPPARR